MKITKDWIAARIELAQNGELPIPKNLDRATQALFVEYAQSCRAETRGITPPYNLTKRDTDESLSMYQIYMQCESEYEAAIVLLGDYRHWEKLCTRPWFKKKRDEWERERAIRDTAGAISGLRKAALNGNAAAAEKLMKLVEPKKPVGRPTRQQKQDEINFHDDVEDYLTKLVSGEQPNGTIQ